LSPGLPEIKEKSGIWNLVTSAERHGPRMILKQVRDKSVDGRAKTPVNRPWAATAQPGAGGGDGRPAGGSCRGGRVR